MKMRGVLKLAIKGIIVLAPLWGLLFFCKNRPLAYLSKDSISAYWNSEFTHTKQEKEYNVIIIGDSMGLTSFMPELLSDYTVNLSLAGSTPIEGYYTLETYLENNDAPSDAFVSYMDYHLEGNEFTWDVSSSVHKFSYEQCKDLYDNLLEYECEYAGDVPVEDFWYDYIQKELYSPSVYGISPEYIFTRERYDYNTALYDRITYCQGRYCKMTNDSCEREGYLYTNLDISPIKDYYYHRIVDLCKENNINLHIIKLPLNVYTDFSQDYIDDLDVYYGELLGDDENMEFVWYNIPYYREWMWDQYHMNQHGSNRFSLRLKEDYPDIWGDYSASPTQMLAINDDINIENVPAEVFNWIDQKDYTVILYDNTGLDDEFCGIYLAYFQYNEQSINPTDIEDLYFVTGDGDDMSGVQIKQNDNNINISLSNQENVDIDTTVPGLTMVVIDDSNSIIVRVFTTEFDTEEQNFNKLD